MSKKNSYSKKISAVICTYNRYDLLDSAITSCLSQSLSEKDYEVIVVDNSPTCSDMEKFAEKYEDHKNVRYVIEKTPGLSNARNVGAKLAQSPLVAYIDDDAIADERWLEETLKAFESFGDKAAVVGGRIDPIWSVPRPDWLPDEMLGMLTVVNYGGSNRIAGPNEWFAGANISFRVSALQGVGGFNVALGRTGGGAVLLSNEESAVVDALKAKDYFLVYAPGAKVDHLVDKRRLEQSWIRKRQTWQAVSDFLKSPEMFEGKEEAYWGVISRYYSQVKPRLRTPAGLFANTENKNLFQDQVRANYCMVALMLMGGADVDMFKIEV